jgi:4-hydroxybenzoate polyprenyltransferase
MATPTPVARPARPAKSGGPPQLWHLARLLRLDRPVGNWLLLWPALWALWLAGSGRPSARNFLVFVAGVLVMRALGCVINDLADRRIDPQVRRTADRPLATGAVSTTEALTLACALAFVALALLVLLNPLARLLALAAAGLTVLYPFCKRFLQAPQIVLGAAFAMSVPMAWAAETDSVPRVAWLWWLVVVVWTVIYDTMYAMADREDDLAIGVKSTAVLFGTADLFMLAVLKVVLVFGLVLAGQQSGLGPWYQAAVAVGAVQLVVMSLRIRDRDADACLAAFRANTSFGATIFAGIALHYVFLAPAAG